MRRQALLAVLAMVATRIDAHGQGLPPGLLTIDLDQWRGVRIRYQGQEYVIAGDELWTALREF